MAAPERLTELEAVIERSLQTFIEVGQVLQEIREQKLYRKLGYSTFEEYCRERWGWSRVHAHRQIEAAETAAMLPVGNKPTSERQVRELVSLAKENPSQAREVWEEATKNAEERGGKPTAHDIQKAVKGVEGNKKPEHRRDHTEQQEKARPPKSNEMATSGKESAQTRVSHKDAIPDYGAIKKTLNEENVSAITIDVAQAQEVDINIFLDLLTTMIEVARAAGNPAYFLLTCFSDRKSRDAAERMLSFVEPPSTDDEIPPEECERYEKRVLREMSQADPNPSLYQAIMKFGGIRFHEDLHEEYREIPLCYRRRDGLPGDEMAEMLATHYSQFGIHNERDLIDSLTHRKPAA